MSVTKSRNQSVQLSNSQSNHPRKTSHEIDKIVKRLAIVDRTCQPPGSNTEKIDLGYGRYEFPHRVYPEIHHKHMNQTEIANIVDRLHKEDFPSHKIQEITIQNRTTCSPDELEEILQRLTLCNFEKYPVESTRSRQLLGFNRYDWGGRKIQTNETKKVTKDELNEIIERLTQYDINKTPPESKGHGKM